MINRNATTLYVENNHPKFKRYCGNRVSRPVYILLILVAIILLLFLVIGLSLYLAIIPSMIRSNFGKLGNHKDGNPLKFSKLNINGFNDSGFHLDVATTLPPLVPWLPASMKLLNPVFVIGSRSGKYVELKAPDMDIRLNQPFILDMGIDIVFTDNPGLRDYIKHFMNDDRPDLVLSSDLMVEILGSVWYRGLAVEKVVDFNVKEEPVKSSSTYNGTIPEAIVIPNPNEIIRQKYPDSKRIVLGSNLPDIVWEDLDLDLNDYGMKFNLGFEMENPTIVTLDLPEITLGFGVNLVDFLQVSISQIHLGHGINEMNFEIGIKFVEVDENTGNALGDLLNGSPLSIHGPIILKSASFMENVSSDLKLELSLFKSGSSSNSSLTNLLDSSDILEKSDISVNIDDHGINIPLSLIFPRLFPLPPRVKFPASVNFGIFGTSVKAIEVTINPITIDTSNEFTKLKTEVKIIPVNTWEAADSLSGAINPLISLKPSNSSVGIGDIKFKIDEHVLRWSESLIKSEKVDVPLSAICIECLIRGSTEMTASNYALPRPKGLDISQLVDVSGFSISAMIDAPKADGLQVEVNLGYFGMSVELQRKEVISFDLPSGIHLSPDKSEVSIKSRLLLSHEPLLASNLQAMLNSIQTGDQSSILGVSGILLGNSEQNSLITFSKLIVEIDVKELHGRALPRLIGENSNDSKPLGALTSVGIEIKNSKRIEIGAAFALYELPFSLSIGSISLNAMLNNDEILSLTLSPIAIFSQKTELELFASLGFPSGNLDLSKNLSDFVDYMQNSESLEFMKLFITGLTISPQGVTSGSGIIDQFKALKIEVDLSGHNPLSAEKPWIDTSPIMDSIEPSSFGLKTEGIIFQTLPKSALFLSANLTYDNGSRVKIILPYFKIEVALQDVSLVEQTITGINLAEGRGSMSPKSFSFFQQHNASIQDHLADLIMEMDGKKRFGTKISLKGIYFGLSDLDRNDLFSKIDLDVSKYISNINLSELELPNLEKDSYAAEKDSMKIRKAHFHVLPGKVLVLDALIGLKSQSPISANIGSLEGGFSVNNSPLLEASVSGINANFESNFINVGIGADLVFQDNEQTPTEIASLVRSVQTNKPMGTAVKLRQFSIGYSDFDKIHTFSKVNISIPVDAFLKRLQVLKRDSDNSQPIDLGLKARKLELTFEPRSSITAAASADLSLSYNTSISVPYLDARIAIDNTYAFRSTLRQISITSSELSGGMRLAIQDSEELENKLGRLTEFVLNGEKTAIKGGIQGIIFGYSEEDVIMAFSQIDLEIPFDPLIQNSSSDKGGLMNALADAYLDAINIKNVDLQTVSGPLMKTYVELEFISSLNVTVNGLGHLSVNIAIDNQTIVETALSGLQLNHGSNKMNLEANLRFESSRDSQIQVATLVNDLIYKDPSTSAQIVGGSGFLIGYSSNDCIKAFRKVKIGIPASKILKNFDSDKAISFDPGKNLIMKKNHIDMSQPGAIKIGLDFSILNLTFPVSAKIGYMGVNTKLQGAELARVGINSFKVTRNNSRIAIACDIQIDVPGGDDIKLKVAQTAKNIMENGIRNASVSVNVYNINLGAHASDLIDTFTLISADINPLSYLPAGHPSPSKANNRSLEVDVIYVDVLDSRRLGAEVHARLIGLPSIQLNVPYFGLSSHMDGEELLEISANDILLSEEGFLSFNSVLYTHKNLNAAQKIAYIVGDILFHRPHQVANKMNFLSVRFGSSEKSSIDIFECISLDTPMAKMLDPIDKIQERPETWIELWEMKSKISVTGLEASVVGKPFPQILPFAAKNKEAGATAKIGFGPNGTQTVVNIFFKDLFFTPGKPFTGNADIQVLVPEILPFLKLNVPHLFEWKDYDQNVSVGWPVLTIGDPHKPFKSFDPFDQIFMDAPPLFLWTPLTFNPRLVNPFKNGLGLDVDIHVPNPGPLFADFGFLTTRMYHKGKEVATVTNSRPVIIKNKLNGGQLFGTNVITLQVRMHLSRNPFKAWEELSDIIHNFKDYTVDIESSTPELGRVEWLSTCFNHIPEYMTGQIVPMLISMLSHIKLKVGPWTITPPDRFRKGSQMMLNKLDPEHIKFIGSEVEVDNDHFMAQGYISSLNGLHDAKQYEEWPTNPELSDNNLNDGLKEYSLLDDTSSQALEK